MLKPVVVSGSFVPAVLRLKASKWDRDQGRYFSAGQIVDVRRTHGHGFQGGVKRHGFKMQDAVHGNSVSHRAPGSIGQCQTPGRVFKGKKMASQMGNATRSSQNLEVMRWTLKNLILVRGSVAGPRVVMLSSPRHQEVEQGATTWTSI